MQGEGLPYSLTRPRGRLGLDRGGASESWTSLLQPPAPPAKKFFSATYEEGQEGGDSTRGFYMGVWYKRDGTAVVTGIPKGNRRVSPEGGGRGDPGSWAAVRAASRTSGAVRPPVAPW